MVLGITAWMRRMVPRKGVLLKYALVSLLLYTALALLLGFYSRTSDARYGYIQRTVEVSGWYGMISDAFLLPIVATAITAFLVSLVYAGAQDFVNGRLDRLKVLCIAALFVLAGTTLRLYLLLGGWVWGSDWGLHSGMVYEMMLYKDYRGFGWGWAGGSPSDPSSTYICNPPLPYLITLFLLNTFIPNRGVPESTYLGHINQYITPMLWVTTAFVESLAVVAVLSVVRRATGRLGLAVLASTVYLFHPASLIQLGWGHLGQVWGQSTLAIAMLFLAKTGEKQTPSNWIALTIASWVTLNTHKSVYVAFPLIVIGYLIMSSITRTVNKTVVLGVATSVAVSEALAWLSFWNYGINYYTELGYVGVDWTIWWDALNRALTPGGAVLAVAGVITLLFFATKNLPEKKNAALMLPWIGVPFVGTLGWIYGVSQSRLLLRYFSTIGFPSVVLSAIPFTKLPRKYAMLLYAAFLVYVIFELSMIRVGDERGMV